MPVCGSARAHGTDPGGPACARAGRGGLRERGVHCGQTCEIVLFSGPILPGAGPRAPRAPEQPDTAAEQYYSGLCILHSAPL